MPKIEGLPGGGPTGGPIDRPAQRPPSSGKPQRLAGGASSFVPKLDPFSQDLDLTLFDPEPFDDSRTNGEGPRWEAQLDKVLDYWRAILSPRAKASTARRAKILARLKEGYSVGDLMSAVDGCAGSAWHREGHHTDVTLICRDAPHVDRFIALAADGPRVSADDAFAEIMRAIRANGRTANPQALDLSPRALAIVKAIGWRELCDTDRPDVLRARARLVVYPATNEGGQ